MFFKNNCTQIFITRSVFINCSNKWEQKHRVRAPIQTMIMQILQSLWRLHQIEHEQAENIKRAEDKKKKKQKKKTFF